MSSPSARQFAAPGLADRPAGLLEAAMFAQVAGALPEGDDPRIALVERQRGRQLHPDRGAQQKLVEPVGAVGEARLDLREIDQLVLDRSHRGQVDPGLFVVARLGLRGDRAAKRGQRHKDGLRG
jgi:hypothetical protein